MLFRVRLKSHGYVVAAKGTHSGLVHRLQHEAAVYDFGGKPVYKCLTTKNVSRIIEEVDHSAQAIHSLGVLHKDLEPRNIL